MWRPCALALLSALVLAKEAAALAIRVAPAHSNSSWTRSHSSSAWRERRTVCAMSLADRPVFSGDASSAKVANITSMEIFEAAVEASHGDRLVIIKAYVPWCRACKAFDLKYRRLGLELEQQDAPASFYEIDVFAVKDVKQLLDIKVAPSVIMFINGEKVESFSCGPKRFDLVAVKVQERLRELTGGGDGAEGEDAFHMTPPEPEPAEREEQPDY